MEDLSGLTVRDYELKECIGAGGFGAVYRAWQPSVDREVAIKVILPEYADHPDFIERFEKEAQLVARLEHPNIIPLYEYWRDETGAYLVMRWLKGGNLREYLGDGPLELSKLARLLEQIGEALGFAHEHDVIHRDLKPENILLDEAENAYLTDFGIAKDLSGSGMTETGKIIGSVDYLSPEQAKGEPITPQTDIYAMGLLIYELLTREHPFAGSTPVQMIQKHLNESLPAVAEKRSDLPPWVDVIIGRATAKAPDDRYPDVETLLGDFRQAVAAPAERTLPPELRAPARPSAEQKHNLPAPLTSFVGRRRELDEVADLLKQSRLLTLTGPPGSGKTRLALKVAAQVLEDFADGVYLVELAPLKDPALVADTVATTLGVMKTSEQPIATVLENYLGNKELLLILDNFEHLLEAAPLVERLLSAAPELRCLVTSREALRLYGEQDYPVPPLGLPDLSDSVSPSALKDYEAVALLIQRARASKPDFALTDKDSPSVAEICVRLDGLPLAIELVAAQVKLFSPQALLSQLESRFTALEDGPRGLPERQRTLRGAIDWSYKLLDDAEKTLIARLSVFQGGRTIEAVEVICGNELPIDVLDGLASLLNKNLLRTEEGPEGEPRFTMLETIHEYARERLQDSGEAEDLHRRHAEYFTALAERAQPHIRGGSEQIRWLRRLEAEHNNLRAMYRWSMKGGEVELRLRLVGALGPFWWTQGYYDEGQQWIERALEVIEDAPLAVRSSVYYSAGIVFFYLNEIASSKSVLNKALALYRDLGSRRDIGRTLVMLAGASVGRQDEYEDAVALGEEALALLREADDKFGIASALNLLGELARFQGNLPRAKRAYEEAVRVMRDAGDRLGQSILLLNLGFIALHEGDVERAQAMLKESLTLQLESGLTIGIGYKLLALTGAAVAMGRPERAARLNGAAEALYEAQGILPDAIDVPEFERYQATAREQLDEATFETAWAEGRAMNLDEATAYALEEPASD